MFGFFLQINVPRKWGRMNHTILYFLEDRFCFGYNLIDGFAIYEELARHRLLNLEESMIAINLLKRICMEEHLNFNIIKYKYLSSEDLCMIENDINSESLLDNIIIEGQKYYYEKKENGIVYDVNSNRVGIFKNNHIIID
jgi:hypothetical protein